MPYTPPKLHPHAYRIIGYSLGCRNCRCQPDEDGLPDRSCPSCRATAATDRALELLRELEKICREYAPEAVRLLWEIECLLPE